MSLKDRMALGVNFLSVLKSTKELMTDSAFEPANKREFAEKILEKISEKSLPQLVEEGVDIDSILEWIEKILPIVLQILILFI